MEIKDQNVETATDAEGQEYIAEIDATMTETSADGTVSVAEMELTADPDDPDDVEGHMTITETAPDGTEKVTEFVANDEGVFKVEEESAFENAVEEIFGIEIEDELTQVLEADGNPVGEFAVDDSDVFVDESASNSIEFNLGDEQFAQTGGAFDSPDTLVSDENFEPAPETLDPAFSAVPSFEDLTGEGATYDPAFDPNGEISNPGATGVPDVYAEPSTETDEPAMNEEENREMIDRQAHSDAATEAQQAADDFVAEGDYAAAAQARETAENEAWEAGDASMLGAYDAHDLSTAADKQEDAEHYEQRQAEHAQAGDYEAAKEDAGNAAYAMSDADYYAGGADHTGQAKAEEYNMDNAIWHEGLADDQLDNAAYHAEMGNTDAAESALDSAASEQAIADDFGDRGEHGAVGADYDPSSEVETGGSYEAGYDDNLASIDTGFDAGADMSVDTGFDSGTDASVDDSYDSGMDDV